MSVKTNSTVTVPGSPASISQQQTDANRVEADSRIDLRDNKIASWREVFMFAKPLDWLLMFVGSVFAMVKGCLLPVVIINFAGVINGFVSTYEAGSENHSLAIVAVSLSTSNNTIQLPISSGTDNFRFTTISTIFAPITVTQCFNMSDANELQQLQRQLRYLYTNQTSNWTDLPLHCRIAALDAAGNKIMFNVYGYLVIAAAIFVTAFAHSLCWNITAARQCVVMRREMFRAIMRQDIEWFDTQDTRQLPTQLIDSVTKVQDGMHQIDMLFENICGFLAAFTVALVYGWELGLLIMGVTPFIALSGWLIMRVSSRAAQLEMRAYARAGAVAEETFSNIRTVAALGCEQKQIDKYAQKLSSATLAGIRKGVAVGIGQGSIWGVIFLSYALAFGVGAWLVRRSIYNGNDGRYNVATLFVVFLCVQIGARQLGQIMPNLQEIANIRAAGQVVVRIVKHTPKIDSSNTGGLQPTTIRGKITFKNVSFQYPTRPEVPILDNFSLEIEAGTTVALVGPSGCGKSTIVQLIERFYDPMSGAVMIDDVDVRLWNVSHLRNTIGIVGQEPVLFSTTIGENIRFGRHPTTAVTQAETNEASRKANIYDFILCLPQKYATQVGYKGSHLSGGEKQRIAIARALIKAPPILLLDEATSALDSTSERQVQQAIDMVTDNGGRRTVIVIAHRLSTIVNADKIVVLDQGQMVESGTHSELMAAKNLYYSLVQAHTVRRERRRSSVRRNSIMSSYPFNGNEDDDSDENGRNSEDDSALRQRSAVFQKMKTGGLLSMAAMLAVTATNVTAARRNTVAPTRATIQPSPYYTRSATASRSSFAQATSNYVRSARASLMPTPTIQIDRDNVSDISVSASAAADMSLHLGAPSFTDRRASTYSSVIRAAQERLEAEEEEEIEKTSNQFSRTGSLTDDERKIEKATKSSEKRRNLQLIRLIRMSASEWWIILLGLCGALCTGAVMPVYAILLSEMLRVFGDPDLQRQARRSVFWSLMFVVLGVVCFLANLFQFSLLGVAGERLTTRLRRRLFSAIVHQDMQFFDMPRHNIGALTARLSSDCAAVQSATGSALALILQSVCTLAVAFAIGFYFAWKVALVCVGTIPFVIVGSFLEQKIIARQAIGSQRALEKAAAVVVEAIEQIRTVAMLNLQKHFVHEFEARVQSATCNELFRAFAAAAAFAYSQSIRFVAFALAFWAGWQFIRESWLDDNQTVKFDFSDMLKAVFGIMYGAISIGQASSFTQGFKKAKLSSARIFRLIDQRPKINVNSDTGLCPKTVAGEIEFKNVHFRYPARRTVQLLRGLSLHALPGQSYALVGHSGCGKSTVVQLLLRFYDAQSGEILLDGMKLEEYNVKWLRRQFGLVGQEPVLFSGSVRENIGCGCDQPPPYEDVVAAAVAANAHNFIMQLPQQYDTVLGNTGHVQLSGGQKQRIAIARALIRQPRVLLLDEATSALDTESEQIVQTALDQAKKDRTSITIAHRLHTIETCDTIVVIDKGRVAELGTHKELMQKKEEGLYFKAQQQTMMLDQN